MTGPRTRTRRRKGRHKAYAQCECGEYDRRAFVKNARGSKICRNCTADPDTSKGTCLVCLRCHPIEWDHPLGWRVSGFTMALCLNCHAKKSAATTHITDLMARELENASPEERLMLKAVYALIELEYISRVCRNILERIGYPSPPLGIVGDDDGGHKSELRGAASSLLHGS